MSRFNGFTADGFNGLSTAGFNGRSAIDLPFASVWRLRPGAGVVWTYDTGDRTLGVATDSQNNVLIVGLQIFSPAASVWKLNADGALIWSYNTGTNAHAVAVDGDDNVLIAGNRSSFSGSVTVWKLASDGTLLWTYDTGTSSFAARGIDTDANGNVFVSGQTIASGITTPTLVKLTSAGALDWEQNLPQEVQDVAVDGNGDALVAMTESNSAGVGNIAKLASNGSELWSATASSDQDGSGSGNGISVDGSGDAFLAVRSVYKFDSSGNEVWRISDPAVLEEGYQDTAPDSAGNIFAAGNRWDNRTVIRISSSGSINWTYDTGEITEGVIAASNDDALVVGHRSENWSTSA